MQSSYGGMVDFKTYVDGAMSHSQSESTKQSHPTSWLASVVGELIEHSPGMRGAREQLGDVLQAEVPLTCELREPGWSEPVKLSGFADSVLGEVPGIEPAKAVAAFSREVADPASTRLDFRFVEPSSFHPDPPLGATSGNMRAT